jgi:hypothetical protein
MHITSIPAERIAAAAVESYHRLCGGICEDTIRALKNELRKDCGNQLRLTTVRWAARGSLRCSAGESGEAA